MPIGYKMVDGKIEIETDKAEIVKMIFTDYLNGNSMLSIAKMLMKNGVRNGNDKVNWTHCSVGKILGNYKYMGDEFYPQIIDKSVFTAVQERRKEISEHFGKGVKRETIFTDKIFCGECGKPYRKHGKSVWKCKSYAHCKNLFITEDELKTMFVGAVNELIKSKALLKKSPPKEPPKSNYKLRQIENQIKKESSPDELVKLIFKRAEMVYNNSKIYDYESKTEKIKEALDESEITLFDENLFETIVEKLTIFKDGRVEFKFINGITIERNDKNGSGKKGGNHTSANSI